MSKKVTPIVEDAIETDFDAVDVALVSDVIPEVIVDEPVAVVEAPKPVATSKHYVVKDDDSYASLGASLAPKGMTGFKYAQTLIALNGGKTLIAGSEIRLG